MEITIVIVIWAALMLSIIITYNRLLSKRNQVDNAQGAVDAMLKKRYDLLPNLVSIVRVHMLHEKEIFADITALIDKAGLPDTSEEERDIINSQLKTKVDKIFSGADKYPGLTSDTQFLRLQGAWNEAEEQISAARRAYNASVTEYNNAIQGFPGNMFAKNMKLEPRKVFEISEDEKSNPSASELLVSE